MEVPPCTGFAVVKQVVSGDTIVLRNQPRNSAPKEKTVVLTGIAAPKLKRKKKDSEEKDEPYAWEAREFLRDKLIGKEVYFMSKPFPNSTGSNNRELGKIYYPTKDDDIVEELVANGLAKVKKEKMSGKQALEPEIKKLVELEEKAKSEGLGIWNNDGGKHIRSIKYPTDYSKLIAEFKKQPVNAIIESVRLTPVMIILDVTLLPNFYHIPLAISGAKFNDNSSYFKDEAKFVTERRLLQQSGVQVVIERAMNNFAVGSVIHPKGNIAEALIVDGFMCCDDRTIATVHGGAVKLRNAEKLAREKRQRMWKNVDIISLPKTSKKEFQGVVTEIINGEAFMVKVANTGAQEKVFLSSIRSPKIEARKPEDSEGNSKDKKERPSMFDVPYLFEAREFLRKKLIGKKVTVIVDYVQPKRDQFPEKNCCTVMVGTMNIAEALVANGLATVIKHREKDDRSSQYDALCAAEVKAVENQQGLHSKGDPPKHRVNDLFGSKAVGLFPMLQNADRITAIVEYVSSGSRMRLYIPKDSLMITFLLSGISCPRASLRNPKGDAPPAEPFGDEAMNFTRDKVLHREVEIRIENIDKKGGMVGTLTVNNVNLALALVEAGLAEIHSSCSDRALIQAEKVAKENKIAIWQNRQEDEQKSATEDDAPERKVNFKNISVSVISPELYLYAHHLDERKALSELADKLQQALASNPHTYSKDSAVPKGKTCAAKYAEDNLWYRGKVEKKFEKVQGNDTCKALIHFIDYGNKQLVSYEDLAPLPDSLQSLKPFAHEYGLACLDMPPETYYDEVALELAREITGRTLRMNIEYVEQNRPYVTLVDPDTNEDCNKTLIEKGLFYAQRRREKKLQSLIKEYNEAEAKAKKDRSFIWEFGDCRADDAKEFGLSK